MGRSRLISGGLKARAMNGALGIRRPLLPFETAYRHGVLGSSSDFDNGR